MKQQSYIPARASRTQDYSPPVDDEEEIPDSYYPQRMPTSTRRYVDTRGNQVIEQGKKRIVIHDEAPPKRKVHWLLILAIGMALMLGLYVGLTWLSNWWSYRQLDAA